MLTGYVNENLDPIVSIEIADTAGHFHSYDVVLDTGFNGELALPANDIHRLGLHFTGQLNIGLAVGEATEVSTYIGVVCWQGSRREVVVVESDVERLLGMRLLSGSKVTVIADIDGEVLIEDSSTK